MRDLAFRSLVLWFAFVGLGLPCLATDTTNSAPASAVARAPEKIIRFGSDVRLTDNQSSGDIVVIGGNAVVCGHVQGSVVVLHGRVEVDGTVESNIVIAAGSAVIGPKAQVKGNIVRVSATLKIDPAAKLEGSVSEFSGWQEDWLAHGLFRGRPFPPHLLQAWLLAGLFILIHLVLSTVFPRSALAVVETLTRRPVASFFVGLLTLLLLGPMVALLAVSRAGVPVIPFGLSAVVAATVFGKIAVYRASGQRLGWMLKASFLQRPLVALVVGSAVLYLLYMLPWAGFTVLYLVSIIGLGAAVLAALGSLRRETARATATSALADPDALAAPPVISSTSVNDPALWPRVGFWRRLGASLLDFCLLLIVLVPLKKVWLLLWLTYHVIFWATKGTTFGGMVMGLRIVREDGRPLTWGVALVRAMSALLSALALGLGFLWVAWSREKRAWHDRLAGTMVVKPSS